MKVYLVLDNIRSAFNVGSIFRTADCLGSVEKIFLCGITPSPDNPRVIKTALGAGSVIDWEVCDDTTEVVDRLQNKAVQVLALETGKESRYIKEIEYSSSVALIVGHEKKGISRKVLDKADVIVEIPMRGVKSSLNVGVATAIAVYEVVFMN